MTAIHELLSRRWSPRAFAPRAVESDTLRALFEAARWAPSCYNDQPWAFVVTRREQDSAYQQLLSCLMPANQAWAATAPLLILTTARKVFAHNGQAHRWAWYDLGQAVGNLLCEATSLGLCAHQMAGFDAAQAHSALQMPEDYDAVAVMALGYLGDPGLLPSGVEEKSPDKRERRPLAEFVYAGAWRRALD